MEHAHSGKGTLLTFALGDATHLLLGWDVSTRKHLTPTQARSQGGAFWGRAPPLKWSAPPLNVPRWMFTIECPPLNSPRCVPPVECPPAECPPPSAPSPPTTAPGIPKTSPKSSQPTTPLRTPKSSPTTPLEFLKLRRLPPPRILEFGAPLLVTGAPALLRLATGLLPQMNCRSPFDKILLYTEELQLPTEPCYHTWKPHLNYNTISISKVNLIYKGLKRW